MSKKLGAIVVSLGIGCALAVAGPAAINHNEGVTAPVLVAGSGVAPEYPPAAFDARIEGIVTSAALVLTDGSVGLVEPLDSSRPNLGFEKAVEAAVRQWRFEPAQKDGQAVDAFAVVTFQFRRQGGSGSGYVAAGFVPLELLGGSIVADPGLVANLGLQGMQLSSFGDPEPGAYTPRFPALGPGDSYHYKDWWPPREPVRLQSSNTPGIAVK